MRVDPALRHRIPTSTYHGRTSAYFPYALRKQTFCGKEVCGVRSPAGVKDFSSNLCVQTGSGAHPASCTMGTGGPFLGGKARPRRVADHSPPSSAEVVDE
jgi:hypothetical protein